TLSPARTATSAGTNPLTTSSTIASTPSGFEIFLVTRKCASPGESSRRISLITSVRPASHAIRYGLGSVPTTNATATQASRCIYRSRPGTTDGLRYISDDVGDPYRHGRSKLRAAREATSIPSQSDASRRNNAPLPQPASGLPPAPPTGGISLSGFGDVFRIPD